MFPNIPPNLWSPDIRNDFVKMLLESHESCLEPGGWVVKAAQNGGDSLVKLRGRTHVQILDQLNKSIARGCRILDRQQRRNLCEF